MSKRSRRGKRREARRSLPLQSLHNLLVDSLLSNGYLIPYDTTTKNKFGKSLRNQSPKMSRRDTPLFRAAVRPERREIRNNDSVLSLRGMRGKLESKPVTLSMARHEESIGHRSQEHGVCRARRERREILHAIGRAGRKGQRSPVFTLHSKISCKKG